MMAILTGMKCYLNVVLICISLTISNIDRLFMSIGHLYVLFGEVNDRCPYGDRRAHRETPHREEGWCRQKRGLERHSYKDGNARSHQKLGRAKDFTLEPSGRT